MSIRVEVMTDVEVEVDDIISQIDDDDLLEAIAERRLSVGPGEDSAAVIALIARLLPDTVHFDDGRVMPAAWLADDILAALANRKPRAKAWPSASLAVSA